MIIFKQSEYTSRKLKLKAKLEHVKRDIKDLPSKLGIGYKEVPNVERYIRKNHITHGKAQKHAIVSARDAKPGETVVTKLKRNGLLGLLGIRKKETTNTAGLRDKVITNPGGEQYIVKREKFNRNYKSLGEGKFLIESEPRDSYYRLRQNIKFKAPWGQEMRATKGSYIVSSGKTPDGKPDVYAVDKNAFKETYRKICSKN